MFLCEKCHDSTGCTNPFHDFEIPALSRIGVCDRCETYGKVIWHKLYKGEIDENKPERHSSER